MSADDPERNAGSADGAESERSPVDARWLKITVYLAVVGWLAALLSATRGWVWADRLFPRLVGSVALLLAVTILVSLVFERRFAALTAAIRTRTVPAPNAGALQESYRDSLRSAGDHPPATRAKLGLGMVAVCVLLPLAMYVLGFLVAISLFVLSFDYWVHRRPARAVALALGFVTLLYLFFVVGLGAHFWGGVVGLEVVPG